MKANLLSKISDQQVKSFFNDGVIMIRIIGAELKSTENLSLKARPKKSRQDC